MQNLPNPFNPRTRLRYDLAEASHVTLRVFDARGSLLHTMRGHGRAPLALAAAPSSDRLVSSGGYDNELRIWDPSTGRCLLSLVTRPATTSLDFSPDGELLLCGTSLGEVKWLRVRPGCQKQNVAELGQPRGIAIQTCDSELAKGKLPNELLIIFKLLNVWLKVSFGPLGRVQPALI